MDAERVQTPSCRKATPWTTYVCLTYSFGMKRTTVWLSEQQIARLQKLSKKTGLPMAELVRRFIDEGLKKGA
jgi:hypothetical protein